TRPRVRPSSRDRVRPGRSTLVQRAAGRGARSYQPQQNLFTLHPYRFGGLGRPIAAAEEKHCMLNRYMAPTDTDDQFNVDDIIDDLDRAYEDGKEDLGRMVIGFLQQLAEEKVDLDEAIERTIDLIANSS